MLSRSLHLASRQPAVRPPPAALKCLWEVFVWVLKKRLSPGDLPRHAEIMGPDDKKTVTKHANYSSRGHPWFISLDSVEPKLGGVVCTVLYLRDYASASEESRVGALVLRHIPRVDPAVLPPPAAMNWPSHDIAIVNIVWYILQ